MISLVLGGEKSGKSDYGLGLLGTAPGPRLMIATGEARDGSFRRRILAHRKARGADIVVREVRKGLPETLAAVGSDYGGIIVDSLDFWLFAEAAVSPPEDAAARLAGVLRAWRGGELILVSCEVGLGPVAVSAATREFVRGLGLLNRAVATAADRVHLVVAGLPLALKG